MSRDLPDVPIRVKPGRPKGDTSALTERILNTWDAAESQHPKLNTAALLDLVAELVFGVRINPITRKRDRERIKRTVQRHGKIRPNSQS